MLGRVCRWQIAFGVPCIRHLNERLVDCEKGFFCDANMDMLYRDLYWKVVLENACVMQKQPQQQVIFFACKSLSQFT